MKKLNDENRVGMAHYTPSSLPFCYLHCVSADGAVPFALRTDDDVFSCRILSFQGPVRDAHRLASKERQKTV